MIGLLLIVLIALWFLGYIHLSAFPIPDISLFVINAHTITLWDLLIFIGISWAVGILPSPLRQIAGVIVIFWVLSTLGIIAIAGLSSILVLAIILGLIASLVGI